MSTGPLTVGTYSLGNLFVVYDIRRQVYGAHSFNTKHERNGENATYFSNGTIPDYNTLDGLHFVDTVLL